MGAQYRESSTHTALVRQVVINLFPLLSSLAVRSFHTWTTAFPLHSRKKFAYLKPIFVIYDISRIVDSLPLTSTTIVKNDPQSDLEKL